MQYEAELREVLTGIDATATSSRMVRCQLAQRLRVDPEALKPHKAEINALIAKWLADRPAASDDQAAPSGLDSTADTQTAAGPSSGHVSPAEPENPTAPPLDVHDPPAATASRSEPEAKRLRQLRALAQAAGLPVRGRGEADLEQSLADRGLECSAAHLTKAAIEQVRLDTELADLVRHVDPNLPTKRSRRPVAKAG